MKKIIRDIIAGMLFLIGVMSMVGTFWVSGLEVRR